MNTIWIVMPVLIVLMFLLGIDLNKKAFADIALNPKAVLLGMIGQILLLPLAAFALAWTIELPPVYFMGLVLIACCPGGSSSNVFSMLAKGDVALSVTLTALSSILTLFTLPFIMGIVGKVVSDMSGVEINLPIGKLLVQNIVLVFVPMSFGYAFRHFFPEAASKVHKVLSKTAFPALMVLALTFFLQYPKEIAENFRILGLSAALLILVAMLCGSAMSRIASLNTAARRTIIIEVGMQNAAQAIMLASIVFHNGEMALPAIMYALLMNLILLTYVYIIRKKDNISSITQYSENQIQSSYEMLWSDIRNPANGSAKTVFNTMRRILENYFNIIGGIDYEACVNQFEGEDKVICKSLISCINEQSHTISDDYFMCVEDSEIEQYLRIFSEIFEKMGHISHYNMMMRI